eukprot:36187-Rhodomonas_salina.2
MRRGALASHHAAPKLAIPHRLGSRELNRPLIALPQLDVRVDVGPVDLGTVQRDACHVVLEHRTRLGFAPDVVLVGDPRRAQRWLCGVGLSNRRGAVAGQALHGCGADKRIGASLGIGSVEDAASPEPARQELPDALGVEASGGLCRHAARISLHMPASLADVVPFIADAKHTALLRVDQDPVSDLKRTREVELCACDAESVVASHQDVVVKHGMRHLLHCCLVDPAALQRLTDTPGRLSWREQAASASSSQERHVVTLRAGPADDSSMAFRTRKLLRTFKGRVSSLDELGDVVDKNVWA